MRAEQPHIAQLNSLIQTAVPVRLETAKNKNNQKHLAAKARGKGRRDVVEVGVGAEME
jgi:hypothetical protein